MNAQASAPVHTLALAEAGKAASRRVLAIVLPHFLSELALENLRIVHSNAGLTLSSVALGVVLTDAEGLALYPANTSHSVNTPHSANAVELLPKTRLDAVSHRARQFGVRPGQTITEARALLSEVQLCELPRLQVEAALERLADCLGKFAQTVAFESTASPTPVSSLTPGMGTLWLDITGVGHLFGGESALAREVADTVRGLGHQARVAVAPGPHLAQAFACWPSAHQAEQIFSSEALKEAVPWLPIAALPVEREVRMWLARLGILTFADLGKLSRKLLAQRLGKGASRALDLVQGKDNEPLKAYQPKLLPKEAIHWGEPITSSEPLLFALRGLTAKIGARLEGRAMAAQSFRVTVFYDRSIARMRNAPLEWHSDFELVAPLYRAEELWKVTSSRLSQLKLSAPCVGLQFELLSLAHRQQRQLDFVQAGSKLNGSTPEAMAVLFGELATVIGRHKFGVLALKDSHRPEQKSLLEPVELLPQAKEPSSYTKPQESDENTTLAPTRLLTPPLLLHGALKEGELWGFGLQVYTVKGFTFIQRIEGIEWWSKKPTSRDYYRVWLENPSGALEALVFFDRTTRKHYAQGFYD
jgi:protein ImuB